MHAPICFMQTNGLYVNDNVSETLYSMAIQLATSNTHLLKFAVNDQDNKTIGEGVLTTQFKTVSFGSYGGMEFEAEIALENRQFRVTFIVNEKYLREHAPGIWIDIYAEPERDPITLN